jgi:hypothetical protein
MQRRDFLSAAAASAAVALLPNDALAAWTRVASNTPPADSLTAAQLTLIGTIADTILPRTDSPSATDVGVPAFINVIVSENYTETDRLAFTTGLDAIDTHMKANAGDPIGSLEALTERRTEPSRTYWRLKGLIIHGYFTSEPVMKNVLHYEIMPGKYDGNAPMKLERATPAKRGEHHHG